MDFEHSDYFSGDSADRAHPGTMSERRLLIGLMDLSQSMGTFGGQLDGPARDETKKPPIRILEEALFDFLCDDVGRDDLFTLNGEVGMAGFWGHDTVTWLPLGVSAREGETSDDVKIYWARGIQRFFTQNFSKRGQDSDKPAFELEAQGGTPMCRALWEALDLIDARAREWNSVGSRRQHRPVVVVLTDGEPTDMYEYDDGSKRWNFDRPTEQYLTLRKRIHEVEQKGDVVFWIACLPGANLEMLKPIADKANLIELGDHGIHGFMAVMSASLGAVGNGTAGEVYDRLAKMWKDEVR